MRNFLLSTVILSGTLAMAQGPSFNNQQRTTGLVGLTPGLTARLNVLYPTAPAPILQIQCAATLAIADDQGGVLKSISVPQLSGGHGVSLELNADTDLAGHTRTQIHGKSIAPLGCRLITTLEIVDNVTLRTIFVVGSETTYPPSQVTPAFTQPMSATQ